MRILIGGDIAIPDENTLKNVEDFLSENKEIFQGTSLIVNLEGLITEEDHLSADTPVLFNIPGVIKTFKKYSNLICACLANNHTLDLPYSIDSTIECLRQYKVRYCGIKYKGKNFSDIEIQKDDITIRVFNYCWHQLLVYQQNPAKNGLEVSVIHHNELKNKLKKSKNEIKNVFNIVYFHWNMDMEVLPFPEHCIFARDLIDNGADLIIGSHSHCIQPFEIYKSKGIFYNIGNFVIPDNVFANGRLFYPDWSKFGYIVELNTETMALQVHKLQYFNKNDGIQIKYIESLEVNESYINHHFPYFNHYNSYFKLNRRKNKLIPVYYHYNDKLNVIKDFYLTCRGMIARKITQLGLRKWQN